MATITTTPKSLDYAYKSVFAPVGCMVMGAAFAAVSISASGGAFKTVVAGLGALFCFWGASIFAETVTAQFDAEAGTLAFHRKRIRRQDAFLVQLAELTGLRLEYCRSKSGRAYRVCLGIAGKWTALTTAYTSGIGDTARKEAEQIRAWLAEHGYDLPLEEKEYDWSAPNA